MFALLALGGDFVGLRGFPALVGGVASLAGENLKVGIFMAMIFPVLLMIGIFLCKKVQRKENTWHKRGISCPYTKEE